MKKLLYLTALLSSVSYGAFRSDYLTATSSMTTPKIAVSTIVAASGASVYMSSPVTGISLSEIEDLTGNKVFTMANKTLDFQFTNPAGGINFDYIGAFSGHAFELHQNTGNPGAGAHLLHVEASDTDVLPIHAVAGASNINAIEAYGIIASSGISTSTGVFISSITSPGANISTIAVVSQIKWADGTIQISSPVAGGASLTGISTQTIFLAASGLLSLETNFAPLVTISTNAFLGNVCKFDDTTRQFKNFSFVPAHNALTTSTVTITVNTTYATSAASKNVKWDLDYYCPASGSAWGSVTLSTTTGTGALNATASNLTTVSWTTPYTTLGWTGGRACKARISRDPGVTDDVTGDAYLHDIQIAIPTSVQ